MLKLREMTRTPRLRRMLLTQSDQWASRLTTKSVPLGILIANTFASGLLAYVATLDHDWVWAMLSAGVAGGLSTFSTWAAQTGELWAADRRGDAINNALLNLLLPVTVVLFILIPQLLQG